MPIYEYLREDGKIVERLLPIRDVPDSIVCEDGAVAKRQLPSTFGFVLNGPGDHWPSQQLKRKRQMTARNIAAGDRGREKWKAKTPKLVPQ